MPTRIGGGGANSQLFVPVEEQVARLDRNRPIRVAVVNGHSAFLGDSVACLTLLRELVRRLRGQFAAVHIELLQTRFSLETNAMYMRSGLVAGIRMLPLPLSTFASYDIYVELKSTPNRPGVPWTDAGLEAIGVAPRSVAAELKRARLELDPSIGFALAPEVKRARSAGRPLLLFHPLAAAQIRSLPESVAAELLGALLARVECTVVCTVPIPFSHERFVDWSRLSSTFEHFAYLVSQVDMFVSVDTATYHVADAFDVPGVVLFTSIDPAARVSYYPFVIGIRAWADDRLSVLSCTDQCDDALHASSLWSDLDVDRIVAVLREAVGRRAAARVETGSAHGMRRELKTASIERSPRVRFGQAPQAVGDRETACAAAEPDRKQAWRQRAHDSQSAGSERGMREILDVKRRADVFQALCDGF
jgi:hypothetical protein